MIDLDLGLVNQALDELEGSLPAAVSANEYQTTLPYWGQLARAYAAHAQADKTAEVIDQILAFISSRDYISIKSIMPLLFGCQWAASHAASSSANLLEIAHTCLSQLERHAQVFHTEEVRAALAEAGGYVQAGEKHPGEAAENFRQAADCWASIDRRYDRARALGSLGRALASLENRIKSRAAFLQALEIVDFLAEQLDPHLQASFPRLCAGTGYPPGFRSAIAGQCTQRPPARPQQPDRPRDRGLEAGGARLDQCPDRQPAFPQPVDR